LLERIPLTIEFTIVPIALGLIAGIFLGVLSIKVRNRLVKLLIQFLIILGISMPMFLIGMWFQYTLAYQLELFPATGNPFLPSCILFLLTLFLTIRQVRSNYLKKSEEKHILSNSSHVIFNLSILFTSVILLESIFNIHGIFELFIVAIRNIDFWTFRAIISIIIVLLVIILLLSNIGYTIYNNILEKDQSIMFTNFFGRNEQLIEDAARYDLNSDQKFKDFTIYRLKSPITIIGLAIVVFTIIVAIFPQVLTPFTMQETLGVYMGSWNPPSATHPLGQTSYGRDVLALLAYGVSTSIIISFYSVLIGLVIGSLFGYLCKVHKVVKELVLIFIVILFVVPCILIIFIRQNMYGYDTGLTITTMAMYMIPGVTLVISKGPYSFKLSVKKLIAYFPLFMGFNILLLEALAFLGFSDPFLIHLGDNISVARTNLYMAPWASFWPGLALYVLVIGFISLHYGLKEPIPIAGRL
jgi:peptide/nickel transport system permease protein